MTSSSLKILVADDSLTYRMSIKELLEDNEYTVFEARDGAEAIDILEDQTPDLAILDILMPHKDGVEVCQYIKDDPKLRIVPVILLTSKDAKEDRLQGLDSGADDYITKPFNEEELLAKIKSLLRFRNLTGGLGYAYDQKSVVLVADDSLTVRMQLGDLLDDGGYKAILAEDGEMALDAVNRYLPDLVVLDVVMPGISGIDVCQRLKSNPATMQIPVIIITSKNDIEDKIRGLNAGADDYLFKPYDPKEFTAKVNAIFRMKKMQLEAERNLLARTNLELQNVNKRLKHTQSQLVQNEKMVALGQLVAGIAHEINNPLAFVSNNSDVISETMRSYEKLIETYRSITSEHLTEEQLLAAREIEDEIDLEYLKSAVPTLYKDINDGLERIRRIVSDLRNFSRLDEAEQKRVSIVDGIESTLNLINHQIINDIEVIREYDDLPEVFCYPSQLNQVFMNVLINSIQAMEKSGGKLKIKVHKNGDMAEVVVEDEGGGISDDVLPRIFEPFYTTKDVGTGTGLGLSISYGIVEKHRGFIRYASKVGVGTTCTIQLPMQ